MLEAAARSKRGEQDVGLLDRAGDADLEAPRTSPTWRSRSSAACASSTPSNHAMVEFYREYYTARNELPQLLTVLAQAQKTEGDVERRVAMGMEMARAAEQRPQHAEKAIEIWKGILRLKPHLPEAVTSLRQLYTRTEKWNALLELLKDDLDAVPAANVDEKINRYLEIVGIYKDRLNLDVMVVNTYLAILALKPDHPAALAALAARYEAQGRYGDLVQILTRQAEAARRRRDARGAAPAHRLAVGRQARQTRQRHRQLREDLRGRPDRHRDQHAPQGAVRQGARVAAADRGLPQGAAAPGRRRAPRPADRDGAHRGRSPERRARVDRALQPGAGGLGSRPRRAGRPGDAVRTRAALAGAGRGARAAAAQRAGDARPSSWRCSNGGARCSTNAWARRRRRSRSSAASRSWTPKNARATRALREIYAQSGDYAALESLYAEHGAFGDLCDQLTSLADRTADMAARTRLLERVALLAQEKLNQPERALKAYERILATDPRNRSAAFALLPLYRAAQKWPRLLATYEFLLGPDRGGRRRRHEPGRTPGAVRRGAPHLRAAARVQGAGVPVVRARVRGGAQERRGAHRSRAAGGRGRRVGARWRRSTRRASARRPTPRSGCGCCGGRCASTRRGCTARRTRARPPSRSSPRSASTRRPTPRSSRSSRRPRRGAISRSCCTGAPIAPPTRPNACGCCSASRSSRKSGSADLGAAAATWTKIVEAEPTNERALRALVRLAEARQDWAGVVEGLRRDLATRAADAHDEREVLLLRIANIQELRLDDSEATFASYREVLQANPHAPQAVAGMERLLAGGYPRPRADRAADDGVLRTHRRRGQAGRGQRGVAGGGRHARRARRAAGEAARAVLRARRRSGGRVPHRAGAVRDRPDRREEPRRAHRLRRGGRQDRRAGRQAARGVGGDAGRHHAPRSAGDRRGAGREAHGARGRGREGLRPHPGRRTAARGRVPRADAPVSRRPALAGAARAAGHAPARRARSCASAWTCWRRSRSWTSRR